MASFEKLERDGKVAVLISPDFGVGWYTWNSKHQGLLFDREIIEQVLAGDRESAVEIAKKKYPEIYVEGHDLEVVWLPKGERFRVHEYNGRESVWTVSDLDLTA